MGEYELTVLYHPDLEMDIDKAMAKVEKIIKDNKGKITATDNWGKRKLAYTIKKVDHAVYVFYAVTVPGENISKLETTLNITNEVIRYLLVKPGPEIEEEEAKADSDEKSADEATADSAETKTEEASKENDA